MVGGGKRTKERGSVCGGGGGQDGTEREGGEAILSPPYLKKYTLQAITSMDHTW